MDTKQPKYESDVKNSEYTGGGGSVIADDGDTS